MRTIEVLDPTTIDKIAAGEVVERPASVVKELVENAIDADSTAITVEIKDGGCSLIRITDNGCGIPADQVKKAFFRHATSKIRKVEDLTLIASLGFRGEALSSISAVSQVELITKTPEALTGIRYCIEGGQEKEFEEVGAPSGSTFLIRNLFFNVPARAKFLKSHAAEGNQVTAVVEQLALSHPDISFKYILNGQSKLYTSGNGNLQEIIYQVYGRDIARELIPFSSSSDSMQVTGFIGKPLIARGNRNFENYFVNGRYVKSKLLAKAIEDGYHGFMMQHRYPFTLLYLEINGEKVDVNVHPAKMELRFSDQEVLYHQLCLDIKNALMQKERIPKVELGDGPAIPLSKTERRDGAAVPKSGVNAPNAKHGIGTTAAKTRPPLPPEPFESRRKSLEMPGVTASEQSTGKSVSERVTGKTFDLSMTPIMGGSSGSAAAASSRTEADASAQRTYSPAPPDPAAIVRENAQEQPLQIQASQVQSSQGQSSQIQSSQEPSSQNQSSQIHPVQSPLSPSGEQLQLFDDVLLSEKARVRHRIIGQLFDTYWLVEFDNSLYIIDQHAAHEKVLYERMVKAYEERSVQSQYVSPPAVISLSSAEAALLERYMDVFTSMGYEVEHFGGKEYKICAIPSELYRTAPEQLFREIMDQLEQLGERKPESIAERLASMSCKAAVKGNSRLSAKEAEALIDELLTLENPYNCPHGRPTIVSMTKYELERKFKRIL
ncbi:MAG: DNA mismatch repair endonuclease MutL [Lachnospiraceae bacterium]|nr:DNA mismatch repair endonuclease MutL [Lachnospiraceae bacterium]